MFLSGVRSLERKRRRRFRFLGFFLFRKTRFESVAEESDDGQDHKGTADLAEASVDFDNDEDEYDEDEMSGYLDVTIEDLSKGRRVGSHLHPITEDEIVVIHSPPPSPLPTSLSSPLYNLKSPSAMRLTRTRRQSPRQKKPDPVVSSAVSSPTSPNFSMVRVQKHSQPETKLPRSRTQESFQGSLESIDSLVESYWDPEDDASQMTPVPTNMSRSSEFFFEHVRFLKVQTQPRQVEIVWSTPPHAKA
jgi:hypothetical protein